MTLQSVLDKYIVPFNASTRSKRYTKEKFDRDALLWIDNHKTAHGQSECMRTKAGALAEVIIAHTVHVPLDTFTDTLNTCITMGLKKNLSQTYGIIVHVEEDYKTKKLEHKSTCWVSDLFLQQHERPSAVIKINRGSGPTVTYYTDAVPNGVHVRVKDDSDINGVEYKHKCNLSHAEEMKKDMDLVLIDDASYSGMQILETLQYLDSMLDKVRKSYNLHLVLPYVNQHAINKIVESGIHIRFTHCAKDHVESMEFNTDNKPTITGLRMIYVYSAVPMPANADLGKEITNEFRKKIKDIKDIGTCDHNQLIKNSVKILGRGCMHVFEHKIPDAWSFPFLLSEWKSMFTQKTFDNMQPMASMPPYKDTEPAKLQQSPTKTSNAGPSKVNNKPNSGKAGNSPVKNNAGPSKVSNKPNSGKVGNSPVKNNAGPSKVNNKPSNNYKESTHVVYTVTGKTYKIMVETSTGRRYILPNRKKTYMDDVIAHVTFVKP